MTTMSLSQPPHNKQTMSPFMLITSGKNVLFYAYQHLISRFMPVRVWKKLYITFTQNRVFFRSGLSGLRFRSRQNTQCDLLGLPVLCIITRFCGHTEFLRALGHGKGRVHNLNSNPEVCHTNILIPKSQVALVETSINTTKNRFRFCIHPTCSNMYFVPKPRLW